MEEEKKGDESTVNQSQVNVVAKQKITLSKDPAAKKKKLVMNVQ